MKLTLKPLVVPLPARGGMWAAYGPACPVWPREQNMGPFAKIAGKKVCGYVITKPREDGEPGWQIGSIGVIESVRRSRVGTALYEKAAQAACAFTDRPLISDTDGNRSPYAEGFWQKQAAKGRAVRTGNAYQLSCPAPALDGHRRRRRR